MKGEKMATLKAPFALDRSLNTTEVTPRNIADVLAEGLSHITGRTASEVEYDNTDSGLTADNVQDALDEIAESVPTLPTTDIQTAVDEFETYNGGLLSECKVALSPIQDLHGYDNPWVGGASKNKMPLTVENLKAWNTSGTWSGNTYSYGGMDFSILTDDANNVIGIDENGATSTYPEFLIFRGTLSGSYRLCKDNARSRVYVNGSQVNDGTSDYSFTASSETYDIVLFTGAVTLNHKIVKPMLVLSTETDFTFEPYSNICPISGHTQVDVDVSEGQTTQEQVTVNLGGTYYSGTLDVVTGELTVDTASVDLGTLTWTYVSASARYYANVSGIKAETDSSKAMNGNCSNYKVTSLIYLASNDFCIAKDNGTNNIIFVKDSRFTDATDFKTAVSGAMLVYELATPQSIQLSPTMVKTLVGENHLSAPLDGQEITESKYRELFTWDEVESLAQRIATSAVADLRCYQFQDGAYGILAYVDSGTVFYDWVAASPSVKLLSTISVMPPLDEIEFTDSSIYSSSICELIVVGDSDVPVVTHVKVTSGKVVFTLSEALDSTIRCACKVTNSILY